MPKAPDGIQRALAAAFPERRVEGVASAGVSWNDQNETVRVEFADGGAAYLKVATDGDGTRIRREVAVVDYVGANCDVAVPTVLASDSDANMPYLATAPMAQRNLVSGSPPFDAAEYTVAVREVGAALADLHARSFERHGRIVGGDADGLELDGGAWTDVLVALVESMRDWADDRFDEQFDAAVAALRENRDRLDGVDAALLHGDPAAPNLCYDDGAVGLLDWELAHAGDPARELHRAEQQLLDGDGGELHDAFYEGYGRNGGALPEGTPERRPVYDVLWHLGHATVLDRWAESRGESPAETAAFFEREMARRLDVVR